MDKQKNNVACAHTERYINTTSFTIVVIYKLMDGAMAGYLMYDFLRFLTSFIEELSKGPLGINTVFKLFISRLGIPKSITVIYSNLSSGEMVLASAVWILIILAIIVGLSLSVIEALALVALRIVQKGADLVKVIHKIHMVICVSFLFVLGITGYQYYKYYHAVSKVPFATIQKNDVGYMTIGLCVLYVIVLVLVFFYHKDIAVAMDVVSREIKNGVQATFPETSLPMISLLLGMPYAIIIGIFIFGAVMQIRSEHTSLIRNSTLSPMEIALVIGILMIMMIKHISVCFCYKNLKSAR